MRHNLVFKPITRSGNFNYDEVCAIFFDEDEPTEVYLNFEGNEGDVFEENLGKEYELQQVIQPESLICFRAKKTGREYNLKAIDYDVKSVVSTTKRWFKFDQIEFIINWNK